MLSLPLKKYEKLDLYTLRGFLFGFRKIDNFFITTATEAEGNLYGPGIDDSR